MAYTSIETSTILINKKDVPRKITSLLAKNPFADEGFIKFLKETDLYPTDNKNTTKGMDIVKQYIHPGENEFDIKDTFVDEPYVILLVAAYVMLSNEANGKYEIEVKGEKSLPVYLTTIAYNGVAAIYIEDNDSPHVITLKNGKFQVSDKDPFEYITCPSCNKIVDSADCMEYYQAAGTTYNIIINEKGEADIAEKDVQPEDSGAFYCTKEFCQDQLPFDYYEGLEYAEHIEELRKKIYDFLNLPKPENTEQDKELDEKIEKAMDEFFTKIATEFNLKYGDVAPEEQFSIIDPFQDFLKEFVKRSR